MSATAVAIPYMSSAAWGALPDDLVDRAERVEVAMNEGPAANPRFDQFLHPRRIPIRQALEADRAEDRSQPSLFDAECEGYCGV